MLNIFKQWRKKRCVCIPDSSSEKPKTIESLLSYIKYNLKKGHSKDEIKKALLKAGYDLSFVDYHLNHIKRQRTRKFILTGIILLVLSAILFYSFLGISDVNKKIDSHLAKGNLLCSEGKFEEAHKELDNAITLNDGKSKSYYYKGKCYFLAGRYEEAIVQLSKSLGLNINRPYAYFYLGKSHCQLGNFEDGIFNLKKTVLMNSSNKRFQDALDKCYFKKTGEDSFFVLYDWNSTKA